MLRFVQQEAVNRKSHDRKSLFSVDKPQDLVSMFHSSKIYNLKYEPSPSSLSYSSFPWKTFKRFKIKNWRGSLKGSLNPISLLKLFLPYNSLSFTRQLIVGLRVPKTRVIIKYDRLLSGILKKLNFTFFATVKICNTSSLT